MFYCRELWKGIKERPIIYLVFLVTLIFCVIISCTFYRLVLMQSVSVDLNDTYYFSVADDYDNAKIYDSINRDKVTNIRDEIEVKTLNNNQDMPQVANVTYGIHYFANSKGFSDEELNSKTAVAIISVEHAKNYKLNNGDKFVFCGVEYTVIRKSMDIAEDVLLPAGVPLLDKVNANTHYFNIKVIGGLSSQEREDLKVLGLKFVDKEGFNSSSLVAVIVGILILAIAAINVFVAYNYISRKNMHRYVIYKTVGSSSLRIGLVMIIETFAVLVISFFIAISIEYPVIKPLIGEYFIKLKPIDYLAVFAINTVMVLITLGRRVWRIAKIMPADKRYL